jgi:hypothetical protein
VLSTTAPAGLDTVFAAGGSGGLAAAGSRDGAAAGTVSPGCEVVALFADSSWLSALSTIRILRWLNWADTLQRCKEQKLYNSPQCRDYSLRKYSYLSIHEERRAKQIKLI